MGSEHALSDEARVRAWLARELGQLGPGPADPLIDPISPDGRIVRIHLRPFASRQLDPEDLLAAFIRTAREFTSSAISFREYTIVAVRLAEENILPFSPGQVTTFFAGMQAAGYPAVHHSLPFAAHYRPAYRVVARDLLPAAILAAA